MTSPQDAINTQNDFLSNFSDFLPKNKLNLGVGDGEAEKSF